jgi:hypothetical protein
MRNPEIIARVGSTRSLQRLEGGEPTGLTFPIIGSLCDLYKVRPEEKFELQRLWRLGSAANWTQPRGRSVFGYEAYRELVLQSNFVFRYEHTLVPGMLQTERTMRMLFSKNPELDEPGIEKAIEKRTLAQDIFWKGDSERQFRFLMSEAALRAGCDAEQIDRLVEADTLAHATVRYLPFAGGPPALLNNAFTLLGFPGEDDHDIVYVEVQDAFLYFEETESVQRHRMSLETSEEHARSIKEFKL